MPFSWGEGAEDVHSPFRKRPRGKYGMELFLFLMDEVTMLLTWYTFFDKGVAIRLYSWLEVAGSEYSGGHGSCIGVISAYAFMELLHYVLGLFCYNTFEQWLAIFALV